MDSLVAAKPGRRTARKRLVLSADARWENAADRSDFPPIETSDPTKAGTGRPIAKCGLTRRVVGIGGAERPIHERCRAIAVEELQAKIRRGIAHDLVDGHKVLRFG
jgi:hypothetical protein